MSMIVGAIGNDTYGLVGAQPPRRPPVEQGLLELVPLPRCSGSIPAEISVDTKGAMLLHPRPRRLSDCWSMRHHLGQPLVEPHLGRSLLVFPGVGHHPSPNADALAPPIPRSRSTMVNRYSPHLELPPYTRLAAGAVGDSWGALKGIHGCRRGFMSCRRFRERVWSHGIDDGQMGIWCLRLRWQFGCKLGEV